MLSPEASAEPGRWRTDRVPFQRGLMDAASDPYCHTITVMSSAQVGKTETELNILGYFIDYDPAPILCVHPTVEMGKAFSKDRVSPMLRDSPCLQGKVKDAKSRDSGNTTLHKRFPGGHLTIAGANSPASLASRPVRVLLADEIDRWPESAGTEGDPLSLAEKRTTTFWNRLLVRVSTPTIAGVSRIEAAFNEGDKRRFHVPCPECGHMQVLRWAHVQWTDRDPETARYACCDCGVLFDLDANKPAMLRRGEWIAEDEFNGHASFHISELYSPWVPLSEMVDGFLKSKGDQERLKTWVNTSLGETYERETDKVEGTPLYRRREPYDDVPEGVRLITAGVDVQADRFEFEIVGWGEDEESWSLDYQRLFGDLDRPQIWAKLLQLLKKQWTTRDRRVLDVRMVAIDSGYRADDVYSWCKRAGWQWAIPVKGSSTSGKPIINFPLKPHRKRGYLTELGTDTAKDVIYERLLLDEPGAGYMHHPLREEYDEEYFAQLTGEERKARYSRGRRVTEWHQRRARVEALDCRVYAFAALRILRERFGATLEPPPPPSKPQAQQQKPPRNGWVDTRGSWFK